MPSEVILQSVNNLAAARRRASAEAAVVDRSGRIVVKGNAQITDNRECVLLSLNHSYSCCCPHSFLRCQHIMELWCFVLSRFQPLLVTGRVTGIILRRRFCLSVSRWYLDPPASSRLHSVLQRSFSSSRTGSAVALYGSHSNCRPSDRRG